MIIKCPTKLDRKVLLQIFNILSINLLSPVLTSTFAMDQQQFTQNAYLFGADLYKNLPVEEGKNVIFSPFSIQTCLTMAFLAANGQTATEMSNVLKYGSATDKKQLSQQFDTLLTALEKESGLGIANKVYVKTGYELQDQYTTLVAKHFKSAVELLEFANTVVAAKTINTWVEQKTNDRIKDLISPDMLDQDTRAVLVNAIYFKGKWTYPFNPKFTQKLPFWVTPTQSVDVDTMNIKKKFRYGKLENLDSTALELTYKDSDISMLIILPNQRNGLAAVEKKIGEINLNEIDQQMYSTEVEVFLPKFEYEYEVDLNEILIKMGMPTAFDQKADFSGLLKSPEQLYISKVIHKAFIKVDEEGAEAAAATGAVVRMKRSMIAFDPPVIFRAEHPFIFVLHLNQTGNRINLFQGSIKHLLGSSGHDEL